MSTACVCLELKMDDGTTSRVRSIRCRAHEDPYPSVAKGHLVCSIPKCGRTLKLFVGSHGSPSLLWCPRHDLMHRVETGGVV